MHIAHSDKYSMNIAEKAICIKYLLLQGMLKSERLITQKKKCNIEHKYDSDLNLYKFYAINLHKTFTVIIETHVILINFINVPIFSLSCHQASSQNLSALSSTLKNFINFFTSSAKGFLPDFSLYVSQHPLTHSNYRH